MAAIAAMTISAIVCIKSMFLYVYNNTTFSDKVKIGAAAILASLVFFQTLVLSATMLTIISTTITSYYTAFALACIPRIISWIINNVDFAHIFLIVIILCIAAYARYAPVVHGLTMSSAAYYGFSYVVANIVPSKFVVRLLRLDLSAEVAVPKLFPLASFAISTASVYFLSAPISAIFA